MAEGQSAANWVDIRFGHLRWHRVRVVAPGKDRPYDWQILKELAGRLTTKGISFLDRRSTPRSIINMGLMFGPYGRLSSPRRWLNGLSLKKLVESKHGIHLGPLKPRIPECLLTPGGKIQLAADVFLQRLAEVTKEALPALDSGLQGQAGKDEFLLIGRRHVATNNSWMHQIRKLSISKLVRCTVMIHSIDAERLRIGDGEDVKVVSRVGEIVLPSEITDTMMPGVISIPHGFGHNRAGTRVPNADIKPGVSVNDITDHRRIDKLTGNAAFSGQVVSIEPLRQQVHAR